MNSRNFFYRSYKQIGTAFLILIGFFLVFFTVSRSKPTAMNGNDSLIGVAHADVPSSSGSVVGGGGGDSGDDGSGDCGDSGDSGGK